MAQWEAAAKQLWGPDGLMAPIATYDDGNYRRTMAKMRGCGVSQLRGAALRRQLQQITDEAFRHSMPYLVPPRLRTTAAAPLPHRASSAFGHGAHELGHSEEAGSVTGSQQHRPSADSGACNNHTNSVAHSSGEQAHRSTSPASDHQLLLAVVAQTCSDLAVRDDAHRAEAANAGISSNETQATLSPQSSGSNHGHARPRSAALTRSGQPPPHMPTIAESERTRAGHLRTLTAAAAHQGLDSALRVSPMLGRSRPVSAISHAHSGRTASSWGRGDSAATGWGLDFEAENLLEQGSRSPIAGRNSAAAHAQSGRPSSRVLSAAATGRVASAAAGGHRGAPFAVLVPPSTSFRSSSTEGAGCAPGAGAAAWRKSSADLQQRVAERRVPGESGRPVLDLLHPGAARAVGSALPTTRRQAVDTVAQSRVAKGWTGYRAPSGGMHQPGGGASGVEPGSASGKATAVGAPARVPLAMVGVTITIAPKSISPQLPYMVAAGHPVGGALASKTSAQGMR
jgi:hypothetical protein